ncbi:MAG TPA: site-specific integrase [Anaerolineae bacterium]|nr:site-specific integrase [Anaerolineae bacterium]
MMQKKPLAELLNELEQEMLRLGYTEGSMKFYRRRWQMLLQFMQERGETYYSEQLGIDFVEKHFHILEKDFERTLSQAETQELRIIRMIGDFQLYHTVLRRYYKHKEILTKPYFVEVSHRFQKSCLEKGYSPVTIDHYVKQSARFMDYLDSQKISSCADIHLQLINDYLKTLAGYTYKTVEQNICSLRALFKFLFESGEIQTDFSTQTPMVQARKQTRIPSVWTKDELKKLIDAIDRGSPKGKRDYAIILLACCLGLRCADIKNLRLEHFHWEEKRLVFTNPRPKPLCPFR